MRTTITLNTAKERLKGYIVKYYSDVRPDVLDYPSFRRELYGYVVSLTHAIVPQLHGWPDANHRHALRRNLYSFALNEVDRIDRNRKTKKTVCKILTLGLAR